MVSSINNSGSTYSATTGAVSAQPISAGSLLLQSGVTAKTSLTTVSGIGQNIVNSLTNSTIDINSLATKLTEATVLPKQQIINNEEASATATISSIGAITSSAGSFQSALTGLGDTSSIAFTPQSSDSNVASFDFQSLASPKQVNLSFVVQQLATTNTVTLPAFDSSQPLLGSGSNAACGQLTITSDTANSGAGSGNSVLAQISFNNSDTLSSIASKINSYSSSNNLKLSATVLNGVPSPNGGVEQYLQISNGTGSANTFNVQINYQDSQNSPVSNSGTDPLSVSQTSSTLSSSGQDAKIYVGGSAVTDSNGNTVLQGGTVITSSSNTFSSLVPGVNISVSAVSSNDTYVNLTTVENTSGLLSALQTIVSGYNSLLSTVKSQLTYNADPTLRGGLATSSIGNDFLNQMREITTTPITSSSGSVFTLADLGVSTNLDGSLTINTNQIDQVAQTNPTLLANVLASNTNSTTGTKNPGAIDLMTNLTNVILGPSSQFSTLLSDTKTNVTTKIADEQTKLNDETTILQQRYLQQFTAMQDILNSSTSQQSYLTNMMQAWTYGLKSG
jgi:flagellar hook-associated protein 2